MNIAIFYFSGTGNTWWITEKIKSCLSENNIKTKLYSIERNDLNWDEMLPNLLKENEIIGIGFPVHGSDVPIIMKDWIQENLVPASMNLKEEKQTFVYDTMALFSGDTPLVMRKILKKGKFKVKQAINIRMLNNIPQIKSLNVEKEKQSEIFQKAEKKVEKFISCILENKKWVMRRDPLTRFIAGFQRFFYRREIKMFRKLFTINHSDCTLCNICIENCPIDNLSIEETEENPKVIFGPNCVCCMRCFNICPQNAIIVMKRSRDVEKYPRFRGQIPGFNYIKVKK